MTSQAVSPLARWSRALTPAQEHDVATSRGEMISIDEARVLASVEQVLPPDAIAHLSPAIALSPNAFRSSDALRLPPVESTEPLPGALRRFLDTARAGASSPAEARLIAVVSAVRKIQQEIETRTRACTPERISPSPFRRSDRI